MAAKNSTIPVKILYEAVSQTVTIELKKVSFGSFSVVSSWLQLQDFMNEFSCTDE